MKQTTMKVEGFITFTHEENINPKEVVVFLDPIPLQNMNVVENVVTEKTITNSTKIG